MINWIRLASRQALGWEFAELHVIQPGKAAQMPKTVIERDRLHEIMGGRPQQCAAYGPQSVEQRILLQAHSQDRQEGTVQRSYADTACSRNVHVGMNI